MENLSTAELVALYNEAATELNKPLVKRFSDRKTALRRTEEIRKELARKVTPPAKTERKVRQPVFRLGNREPAVTKRQSGTLREQCEALLSGEGATFAEVEELVRRFDRERNKEPQNVQRRAYGLVRLMHYQLGHGLDDRDGKIKIITAQKRLEGV